MKITVKGRVKGFESPMASGVECEGEDTLAFLTSGGMVRLTRDELFRLVAANAPFGANAREQFFSELRAFADRLAPTSY